VKLDADGRLFSGDGTRVEDYAYYGTPVHAVADGTVVNLYDAAEVQVPGPDAVPTGITTENIGGNMIVVDIGGGNFAFYAHLQKGSLTVALGDKVTAGQELGLLGNTGNTTAPHLHFHVMDTSSPLDAQGLPYVFRRFTSRGVVAGDAEIENGAPVEIDARLAGEKAEAMPLNNEVVGFD
jgi:murein DD-endopeptidase MepM/ murein hydrolase activator NlpD